MQAHRHYYTQENAALAAALRQSLEGGLHAAISHREQLAPQTGQ